MPCLLKKLLKSKVADKIDVGLSLLPLGEGGRRPDEEFNHGRHPHPGPLPKGEGERRLHYPVNATDAVGLRDAGALGTLIRL